MRENGVPRRDITRHIDEAARQLKEQEQIAAHIQLLFPGHDLARLVFSSMRELWRLEWHRSTELGHPPVHDDAV